MSRLTFAIVTLLALSTASPTLSQQVAGVTPPQAIAPQGKQLMLVGCDAKSKLFMDVYAVALYLPHAGMSPANVLASGTPKAIRLYPVYDGALPEQIPSGWRERLRTKLSAEKFALVQKLYQQFNTNEVAAIAYAPGKGTVMMVDDKVVARTDGGEVMNGVLETWLGEGDDIKLLSTGC